MLYYHISSLTEYDDHDTFANKLTRCGEPWKLDLTQFDSVPVVKETLLDGQKYGAPVLEPTRYYYPAIAKSAEEIAADLSDRKAQKWLDIKAERDGRKNGGVFVSAKWFHTDTESRIQWLGLVLLGANVLPIEWKTMDGTFITMSPSLVSAVFQAIVSGDSADFANAEAHRLTMLESLTPESYDFSAGWRTVYGG